MDISWIFSKLGMFIGFIVILGAMFKVSEMYDVNAAHQECNELAKKIGDSMSRAATISPQLIQAEGGVYRMKVELPRKLHGEFYSLRLDFSGGAIVEFPQGYRGNRFSCIGIIPAGAIPDKSAGEYLAVNNAYMIRGNNTENYDDDVYVWPAPQSEKLLVPPPYESENPNKEFRIEFITQSDWFAFKIESGGDKLLSASPSKSGGNADGEDWDYIYRVYDPPCAPIVFTGNINVAVKDNGDDSIIITTAEGAGCSKNKAGADTVNFYAGSPLPKKYSGIAGCKSGWDSCTGFQKHTLPAPSLIQPFNQELKSLDYIEVNKTRKGMVVTLGGIK